MITKLNKEDIIIPPAEKLPGQQAWQRMAPEGRINVPLQEKCTDAGVMLLLYPENEQTHIALIKRNEYAGPHSAQISFPGGMKEDSDTDFIHTALRETEEEIGIPAASIEILGALTPLIIPVSNFCVHPFVGWLERTPEFNPDRSEVQYLICPSLVELMDPGNHKYGTFNRGGVDLKTPYIDLEGEMLWGATAMIFSEFMALLGY